MGTLSRHWSAQQRRSLTERWPFTHLSSGTSILSTLPSEGLGSLPEVTPISGVEVLVPDSATTSMHKLFSASCVQGLCGDVRPL
jgi:hypothetical protein